MAENRTILVTGANGQLGTEMRVISARSTRYDFLFVTKEELPIEDQAAVNNFFSTHKIDYCVNCAAYTAVDKAESDQERAVMINATAVGNVAAICKAHNTIFIHVSTDYVFDGTSTVPYKEDDEVSPINAYGISKLQGEELAVQNNPRSVIIRTSWVYSSYGNNFVLTMLRLMGQRDEISVVADQQGCPTYAADLAGAIMKIIDAVDKDPEILSDPLQSKIFNYSNQGITSWYEFAGAIKELSASKCMVNPIPAAKYPTPAKRPQYSVMDTTKIRQTFSLAIPEWRDSLRNCLNILKTSGENTL